MSPSIGEVNKGERKMVLAYVIIRILYSAYFIVSIGILLKASSHLAFSPGRSFSNFIRKVGFAFVWPLSIFSEKGRTTLVNSVPFIS